jgi:hypothetical protein
MKPQGPGTTTSSSSTTNNTGNGNSGNTNGGSNGSGNGKKKQPNATAAGRKIARKTAHSLIERRRRSKMNEEFGVLKDMIPACVGQEMHKLAILQVSSNSSLFLFNLLFRDMGWG